MCPLLLVLSAMFAAAPAQSGAERRQKAAPLSVSVKDGRLSLEAMDQPLGKVLEVIASRAHLALVTDDVLEQRTTIRLADLPLEDALKELLSSYDVFYFHAGRAGQRSELQALWVYARGRGQGVQPVPPESWASTKEMERRLADPSAEVRAKAVETLIDRQGSAAAEAVVHALTDADVDVRTRALFAAVSHG